MSEEEPLSPFTAKKLVYANWRLLPLFTSIVAIATLATIQILAHALNHLPSWFYFAPFSVAAIGIPERYIYMAGMIIAATLFILSAYAIDDMALQYCRESHHTAIKITRVLAIFMALGLAIQGIFTLQDNIVEKLDASYNASSKPIEYTTFSYVHLVSAGIFFGSATVYLIIWAVICLRSYEDDIQKVVHHGSRLTKYICCVLVIVSVVVGFILHPAMKVTSADETRDAYNAGGFMQWTCVLSLMIFLASFWMDLSHAAEVADNKPFAIDEETGGLSETEMQ